MRTTTIGIGMWALALVGGCGAGPGADASPTLETQEGRSEMMVIRVVVDVRPEQVEAFVSHMRAETLQVRELEGCRRYELYPDRKS